MGTDPVLKTVLFLYMEKWTQSKNHINVNCYHTTVRTPHIWVIVLFTSPNSNTVLTFWACGRHEMNSESVNPSTVCKKYYTTGKQQQEWFDFLLIHTQTQNFKTTNQYCHIYHISQTLKPSSFRLPLILLIYNIFLHINEFLNKLINQILR